MKFRPKFFWKWSFFDQIQQPLKSVETLERILRALFISQCPYKLSSFLNRRNASNRFRLFSRGRQFPFFFPGSVCFSSLTSPWNLPSWVKYYKKLESFENEFRWTKFIVVIFPRTGCSTSSNRAECHAGRRTKFAPVKSLDSSEFSSQFSNLKTLSSDVKVNPVISWNGHNSFYRIFPSNSQDFTTPQIFFEFSGFYYTSCSFLIKPLQTNDRKTRPFRKILSRRKGTGEDRVE